MNITEKVIYLMEIMENGKDFEMNIYKRDKLINIDNLTIFDIDFIQECIQELGSILSIDINKIDYDVHNLNINYDDCKYRLVIDLKKTTKESILKYLCECNNKLIRFKKILLSKDNSEKKEIYF